MKKTNITTQTIIDRMFERKGTGSPMGIRYFMTEAMRKKIIKDHSDILDRKSPSGKGWPEVMPTIDNLIPDKRDPENDTLDKTP